MTYLSCKFCGAGVMCSLTPGYLLFKVIPVDLDVCVCAVSFNNIRPGDCIVCFSKKDIFTITRRLEARNIDFAVIYGTLPPGEHSCICLLQWSLHRVVECNLLILELIHFNVFESLHMQLFPVFRYGVNGQFSMH